MKYQPTVDLWNPETAEALRIGKLRLQSGQWVKCGDGPLSIFDATNGVHIRCFHGQTATIAAQHYSAFKAIQRARRAS